MLNKLLIIFLIICSPLRAADSISKEEVLKVAKDTKQKIESIQSYQFILQKKELVDNEYSTQSMEVKVRAEPLAIYIKFLAPRRYENREALYPNSNGDITVKMGGYRLPNLVQSVDPEGIMAMEGNRYPITHINPKVLANELMTKIEKELEFPETQLYRYGQAKIGDQPVTAYIMVHTEKKEGMQCSKAEIGICPKLGVPIFFRVYDFDGRTIEHYAFLKMILNPAFTTDEFDEENLEYGFDK